VRKSEMLPLEQAQKYLAIGRKRGEENATLNRVGRTLRCKGLYLMAYAKLSANKGALTPGTDPEDTVDGMSLRRIDTIIKKLQEKTYQWKPTRRVYISKKDGRLRPLGMPGWEDKLLQEVIRMVLEAYYEPQFRECSHGFRPQRGCHTALDTVAKWKGTRWFIEGDIKGCFDNIDHDRLIGILKRKIKDRDFLTLIKDMLKAGYMEKWTYHATYSGTPQGGIVSPLLANIVRNELDVYVEDTLIPKYTKGKRRKANLEYERRSAEARRAKHSGNWKKANERRREYTKIPSKMSHDENFRRLWYVRYADDTLFGLIGTKAEAEAIKEEFGQFLSTIKLEMSEKKTLITHALSEKARFLNYEINYMEENSEVI
jgi:group II intron reverse transcriptase/maturase